LASLAERLDQVRARIGSAALAAGRDPRDVKLVAVSKTKPANDIRVAFAQGQRDFGENYLQELAGKAEELANLPDLAWHMIGHLQTNKAKLAVRYATCIHTVDSDRIARALGRRREQLLSSGQTPPGCPAALPVLVEVNLAREPQKSGCLPEQLDRVLDAIEHERTLALSGLMTVPPHTEDPSGAKRYFDQLRELRDQLGGARRLPELSMGMSHDLEVAIACGATIVRVGTAIFGERGRGMGTP
jgi:PLP dependent protein